MPFSQHPWLPPAAVAFGSFPALIGLQFLFAPLQGLSTIGYQLPSDLNSQPLIISLLRFFGARDLTIGLLALAVWRSGDRRTLGLVAAIGAGLATMDGFINSVDIPGAGWKHWVFVPFGLVISGGLLGFFD